jgi:hypothetical protein
MEEETIGEFGLASNELEQQQQQQHQQNFDSNAFVAGNFELAMPVVISNEQQAVGTPAAVVAPAAASFSGGSNYKQMLSTIFELTDEDLLRVEEHLREKLVRNGENFMHQHDNLRANYEKCTIEYQQRFLELESEFTECQNKLAVESKNAYLFKLKSNENGNLIF